MNRKFVSKSNRILRKVLNSEDSLDILQDFIETFLKIRIKEIKLNPYLEIKSNYLPSEENFGIADVRVKTTEGKELNVGIQFIDGYYVENKMLLYYAQIHSNQLEYRDNRKIAETVTINLLDFNYFKSSNYFNKILFPTKNQNAIELYVLELTKFIISNKKNMNKQEAWTAYLSESRKGQLTEILEKYSQIKKLDNLLEQYWKNEIME